MHIYKTNIRNIIFKNLIFYLTNKKVKSLISIEKLNKKLKTKKVMQDTNTVKEWRN